MSHQVYQILKDEIISGVYQPNDWLQEKDLAAKLNVSRSPVREALRQLAADGLVREVPNKGMFVRAFTPKEITEIFEVRKMLESYSILALKDKLTEAQKEVLQQYRDELVQRDANYGRIGIYQGGGTYLYGRWRSEKISCMIDNRF